jgi:hypothetical protein
VTVPAETTGRSFASADRRDVEVAPNAAVAATRYRPDRIERDSTTAPDSSG